MPAGEAGGSWAVGVRLFAYFLAEESRSAGGPRPALCPSNKHATQSVNNEQISFTRKQINGVQLSKQHRFVASDRGRESPRQASYLSCSHKKRNPKNATRLSASLRYVSLRSRQTCVTPFRLRCRPTRFALAARRSDKQRQVRARCIDTLRCQCPQPEQRAAGADTRVEAGADSRLDL